VRLPCGEAYFDGCACPACNEHRQAVYTGKIPKLDRIQLQARIAHHRELGDLEPLKPAPKTSWVEELRAFLLIWEVEDLVENRLLASPAR